MHISISVSILYYIITPKFINPNLSSRTINIYFHQILECVSVSKSLVYIKDKLQCIFTNDLMNFSNFIFYNTVKIKFVLRLLSSFVILNKIKIKCGINYFVHIFQYILFCLFFLAQAFVDNSNS